MAKGKNNFFEHQETQRIETPPSSPSGKDKDHGSGDMLGFMQDTVCFDDIASSGEQMEETQVMDIGCEDEGLPHYDETQALPLCSETQEASFADERQWLKASDCLATQLLDHSDDEIAADSDVAVTDVLVGDNELSDGDSLSSGRNLFSDKDSIQPSSEKINSTDFSDALSKEPKNSGNVPKFTSIRTAAFRATVLAARVATPKQPNSDSRSILTNCHSSERSGKGAANDASAENSVGEEVDRQCTPSISGEKANELRMGNKTARKLFPDDSPKETNCNIVDFDNELAGLSYIDSQEPGELSQASAFNIVEKLINDPFLKSEVEDDHGKRRDEMSKFVSSVIGPQVLAKKFNCRGGAVGIDIFNWDDNREDEGGGELFSRRKEEFFGSSTMPRGLIGKSICGNDVRLVNGADKRTAHSDSRLLRNSLIKNGRKIRAARKEIKKNIVNELDKVSNGNNTKTSDVHELVDVGPDTQMAAEAIDALHLGDGSELDADRNALVGKKLSQGVVTRQSKRRKRVEVMEKDVEPLVARTKKARSIPTKAGEKNVKGSLDIDEPVVSGTGKRRKKLLNESCDSKLLNQPNRGRSGVSSYPKRRRSARISRGHLNESGRNSDSAFDTPMKSKMLPKNVSPICMGDEYLIKSLKGSAKSICLREARGLISPSAEPILESKATRKRRDLGSIRVLFSQHLDEDVTKHQKKILARFGIAEASSMKEATHFIADKFVRTRNMLEAIASGKPVVTTQWLESIEQVNIYIDEDPYVLRDSKKEKEFGFNMSVSLVRARHHPLLQGRRVFITPNTKPGKDTLTTLAKAVHGQAFERLGRSGLKDDRVPDNLLILSCVEDFDICVPFLERGAEVYSSELLLNGIVTQKLEYERYRLFVEHVKRTRSTVWIRNDKGEFQPRPR
ncbi:PREDICTED: uncharacterized protein LOC104821764 [Tarenaya hassleriana]|uniref:uncharacterized protein LOC104821764 n=1 Tax=Tarenaya hassleriana TaxID=28532 RepID=UPI00053CA6DB|nr:PREDICTED: uncharacterized protein LOC104821764 [Tarenaya hassleriana]